MLSITQDTRVQNTDYLVVSDIVVDELDLVPCYLENDPSKTPIVAFQASYIFTGENK